MNILIIDDDTDTLNSLKNLMSPTGFAFTTTTSPLEGLSICRKTKFDILVADIKMDEMDGVELIKILWEINKDIKIIVVSAFCDSNLENSLINYNIHSYFQKPLNIKYFINALDEINNELNIRNKKEAKKKNL